jgi:hypothetical protein
VQTVYKNKILLTLNCVFLLIDCDTSDDLSNGSKAQVGTLKLDLPLDEDDYLMPSPANDEIDNKRRHAPANYIDLIGHQHAEGKSSSFLISYIIHDSIERN